MKFLNSGLQFVDDDGKVYLDMRYCFEIRKDWGGA
jgi:Rho GDP-dissociation inhibitor